MNAFLCLFRTRKVLNRDQIMEELRGIEWDAFNRSVDITMSRLRNKLGDDPKNSRFIKTIWGTGYCLLETVMGIKLLKRPFLFCFHKADSSNAGFLELCL
ncbi:MAG: hypothetical protein CM1200mP30_17350 [Pseudomonadota bacterium]|nr:MAG: hypothetical protein CM1200mP30_17350 [Pseudomonadota bacterium]